MAKKTTKRTTTYQYTAAERAEISYNSGYWDAVNERKMGTRRHLGRLNSAGMQLPAWDAQYCAGYEAGYRDQDRGLTMVSTVSPFQINLAIS